MTRIFIDGFENGDCGLWDPTSVATIASTSVEGFKGTYSAYLNSSDKNLIKTLSSSYAELYFAFKVYGAGDGVDNNLLTLKDSAATIIASVSRNDTTGFLELRTGNYAGSLLDTGTVSIANGATHLIEVRYKPLNSGGVFTLKIDGVEDATYTGDTTAGLENVQAFILSDITGNCNFNGYFDDVVVDDADWIGNTYIQAIVPTGAGTTTGWTPSTGANWSCVDEVPAVDTDYVSVNTADAIDTYATSNLTGTITSIKSVQVEARIAYEGTPTPTHIQLGIRSSDTDCFLTDKSPALSLGRVSRLMEVNPATSLAFTESTVNSTEIGIKATA